MRGRVKPSSHTSTHTCTNTHAQTHTCTHTHIHTHTHAQTHTCTHTHTQTHTHTHAHTRTHTHTRARARAHAHAHALTQTHTQSSSLAPSSSHQVGTVLQQVSEALLLEGLVAAAGAHVHSNVGRMRMVLQRGNPDAVAYITELVWERER